MRPRFTTGSGPSPRYVGSIDHARFGAGVICLTGGAEGDSLQRFSSPQELMSRVRLLAQQRVPFNVGETVVWDGVPEPLRFSFLLIAFTNRGQDWSIHEITPGAEPPWERVGLSEILGPEAT